MTNREYSERRGTQRQRDPHCGPVPDSAWERDVETRRTTGRVEIFNATRPDGLDGWTMDADQYRAVHDLILDIIDDDADTDGTIRLQHVVDAIQQRLGNSELFPKGRLTNYVRYTKTDMEARCEIERIPGSSPQRITRWRSTP
jgi:hypothetical protein